MMRMFSFCALLLAAMALSGCLQNKPPKGTLYLSRHGQTSWNHVSRMQGDPDLDTVGYIQRAGLWLLLREVPLAAIYTSNYLRSRRTAGLLARQHRIPVQPRAALDELSVGIFVGICYRDLKPSGKKVNPQRRCQISKNARTRATLQRLRKLWKSSSFSPTPKKGKHRIPLGENYGDMRLRQHPFVATELWSALHRGNVLIVGHGGTNRVLLHLVTGWPLEKTIKLMQSNDQVYRFAGLRTSGLKVSLHTPGVGWKRCSPPTRVHQRWLDCNPLAARLKARKRPPTRR